LEADIRNCTNFHLIKSLIWYNALRYYRTELWAPARYRVLNQPGLMIYSN